MSGMKRESGSSGGGGRDANRPSTRLSNREVRRCALQALYQFDVVEAADGTGGDGRGGRRRPPVRPRGVTRCCTG